MINAFILVVPNLRIVSLKEVHFSLFFRVAGQPKHLAEVRTLLVMHGRLLRIKVFLDRCIFIILTLPSMQAVEYGIPGFGMIIYRFLNLIFYK